LPRIPLEIVDQCKQAGTLLVRGGSGSGKTIFALSLLKQLKSQGMETTYVSTRIPASTLLKTTSLCEELGRDSLVDSSLQRVNETGQDIEKAPMTDLSDLAMLLLQKTSENSVIALDSWDALLSRDKRPDDEVYTATMDLINRTPGSLVFTIEDPRGQNPLEHVADAQVTLQVENHEGSRIRSLEVDKLRGRSIDTPRYIFSLAGGRFDAYVPSDYRLRECPIRAPCIPQPMPENGSFFSTGLSRLARLLGGGYRHGSYVGIEIDLEAPMEVFDMTYIATAADFLLKNRPVIVLPPGARDADSLWDTARSILDDAAWREMKDEVINNHVKVLSFGSRSKNPFSVPVGVSIDDDISVWSKSKKEMKYRYKKPILGIVGYDTLVRMYGTDTVEEVVGRTLPETRRSGDLTISIVTSDLEIKRYILGIADYYFKIKLLNDVPIFWGVKPRTHPYALLLVNDNGVPKTNLHRIS